MRKKKNKEKNDFDLFLNQVQDTLDPVKAIENETEVDFMSYMRDIYFKLNYAQMEINDDAELSEIAINDLNNIQEQLNLYMIEKVQAQVSRVQIDMKYKFKVLKMYLLNLITAADLNNLSNQLSNVEDFTLLTNFFLKFNEDIRLALKCA